MIPNNTHKYKVVISYDGSYINGWSGNLGNLFFIKESILKILNKFLIVHDIQCASRTDSGVHAIRNVLHLVIEKKNNINHHNIIGSLNFNLPKFIRVHSVVPVNSSFHARYSALNRQYIYKITNVKSALIYNKVKYVRIKSFNIKETQKAIDILLKRQNFAFFKNKNTILKKPKTIKSIIITKVHHIVPMIYFKFLAISFFHHQVRNIMGSLLQILTNNWDIQEFTKRLNTNNRKYADKMIDACGLYLNRIFYKKN